jgi:sec-independent protein translocase protein TatA
MGLSFWHLMVVLFAIVILFGLGKLPKAMGDVAKGIRTFKREIEREDDTPEEKKPLAALPKEESTTAALTEKEHQKH